MSRNPKTEANVAIKVPRRFGLDSLDLGDHPTLSSALSAAVLRGADLRRADLRRADLSEADLSEANLSGADLSGAVLRRAELSWADLRWADLRGANLSEADLSGAVLRRAVGLPSVTAIPSIDSAILAAIQAGGHLEMGAWHSCATTHSRAGWAVVLAGDAGASLEEQLGPCAAGALIYAASRPGEPVPDFFASTEAALADLRACAARQSGAVPEAPR
jgi:hypothetical protein